MLSIIHFSPLLHPCNGNLISILRRRILPIVSRTTHSQVSVVRDFGTETWFSRPLSFSAHDYAGSFHSVEMSLSIWLQESTSIGSVKATKIDSVRKFFEQFYSVQEHRMQCGAVLLLFAYQFRIGKTRLETCKGVHSIRQLKWIAAKHEFPLFHKANKLQGVTIIITSSYKYVMESSK